MYAVWFNQFAFNDWEDLLAPVQAFFTADESRAISDHLKGVFILEASFIFPDTHIRYPMLSDLQKILDVILLQMRGFRLTTVNMIYLTYHSR